MVDVDALPPDPSWHLDEKPGHEPRGAQHAGPSTASAERPLPGVNGDRPAGERGGELPRVHSHTSGYASRDGHVESDDHGVAILLRTSQRLAVRPAGVPSALPPWG